MGRKGLGTGRVEDRGQGRTGFGRFSSMLRAALYRHGRNVLRRAWVLRLAIQKNRSSEVPDDTSGSPPRNTTCKDVFPHQVHMHVLNAELQKWGQSREKSTFQTKLRSRPKQELKVSKYFPLTYHTILNNSASFYRSPQDSNLPMIPQQTPQILSLKGNRLPHRPFIFIMSLKFQIKTPGCAFPSTAVHLSSHLLLQGRLHPLSIFLCIFPSTLYLSQ